MPSNIEIKAPLANRAVAEVTAARLSHSAPQIIRQEDFFFRCDGARLKLRVFSPGHGELIRYARSDTAEARRSEYLIARTPDPETLLEILSATLGLTGVVKKTRSLYLIGPTRVHLDEVEDLGDFLELEVVLSAGQSEEEGKNIASALLAEFAIDRAQMIGEAYIDLLDRRRSSAASLV